MSIAAEMASVARAKATKKASPWASNLRSPLALMPLEKLFVFDGNDGPPEKGIFALGIQRRPRPDNPQWKIPHSEWPEVLRRVGQVIPMMF